MCSPELLGGGGTKKRGAQAARPWPIVLVGLLGKILGPLGMVKSLWTGELPWGFALTCVTNDLIWWLPFALLLKYAWEQHRKDGRVA